MSKERNLKICDATWAAFGQGDYDRLVGYYAEDMTLVFPGQADRLEGRDAFRAALDGIAGMLPAGIEIRSVHNSVGENEVVSVFEWTSDKVPDGSQSAIRFLFDEEGRIIEERWFVDTDQWKAAL